MSDTPKDPGAGSGESPEYRDPTAPGWDERGEPTQAVPAEGTQQLPSEPPAPAQPAGEEPLQAPNPYEQARNPYAAGAPGYGYPTSQPGPPPAPGAPGTVGAGFPPGPPPAYGQQPTGGQPYGQVQPYGQQPYGQQGQPGYAPSPYARPRQTNTSAIVLLVVSGLSTLVGCFFAIPALILGIMAVVKQGESPADSAKFTRWGWIAYAIALAFVVIGGIIAIAIFASTTSTGY
jgi:hypothetical protein